MTTKDIVIKTPIWATRSVGLDIRGLGLNDEVRVTIDYEDKRGIKLFPGTFVIPALDVSRYPVHIAKYNVSLHVIPIRDLQEYKID